MAKFDAEMMKKQHFWLLFIPVLIGLFLAWIGLFFGVADATEAKNFYGIELCDALDATGDAGGGAPFDCLVAAVAHNEYRALADEDFVRLVRPGGLIADVKGIWRDRALPGNVRRWQL